MRILLILVLIISLCGCNTSPKVFSTSTTCDELKAIELNNTIIFFDSKGFLSAENYINSPSKKFKEEILADSSLIRNIREKFNFIIINSECENAKRLISKYEIKNFPTIIQTNNEGIEIFRNTGLTTSSRLKKKLFDNNDKKRTKIVYNASYPQDNVGWEIYGSLRGYWEIKSGSLKVFDTSINDDAFIYFNPTGYWEQGDEYQARIQQHINIVRNRKSGKSFDFYIDKNNNITLRQLTYLDENKNLLKNIKYTSETSLFEFINENEIKIHNDTENLTLVRDTLDNWKK